MTRTQWLSGKSPRLSLCIYSATGKFVNPLGFSIFLHDPKHNQIFCTSSESSQKLESICAEVFPVSAMTIKCQCVTCFIKKKRIYQVWSCLWKWIMSRTKEITEDFGKIVDVAHQARKGYKIISKEFGLHKSTVRQIVYELRYELNSSKQLKAFLTLANVNVHEPTIRRTLSNHGVHGARRKFSTVLQKENSLLKFICTSQRTVGERFNGWMKPK